MAETRTELDPDPEVQRTERTTTAALIIAVVALLTAIGALAYVLWDDEPASEIVAPSPDATVTAVPSPGPLSEAPVVGELPTDWDRCYSDAHAFSIGYPSEWQSIDNGPDACRYFDRNEFELPEDSEPPLTDMSVSPGEVSFAETVDGYVDTPSYRVVSRVDTNVADRPAVLVEVVSTGDGLYPEGTMTYSYIIDRDGDGFVVETIVAPDGEDYEENSDIVDVAVGTLELS